MAGVGNDADAAMALRGLQGLFQAEGVTLAAALQYAAEILAAFKKGTVDAVVPIPSAPQPVTVSGMPQCRVPKPGMLELIRRKNEGQAVVVPGSVAEQR